MLYPLSYRRVALGKYVVRFEAEGAAPVVRWSLSVPLRPSDPSGRVRRTP